jgi:hypothetical protein
MTIDVKINKAPIAPAGRGPRARMFDFPGTRWYE